MTREATPASPATELGTDRPDAGNGDTQMEQGETQESVPRMPHERDESADSQRKMEPSNQRMGRAAQKDVEAGLQDTSKANEMDDAYERMKSDLPDAQKKFRP